MLKFRYTILNFLKSLYFHISLGLPKSSQQQILDRFTICKSCEMFDSKNSQCLVCGCNINTKKTFFNKLAWADQKCPLDKWSNINENS